MIAPAQRLANGEIILQATPGGFSTFEFDGRVVGVDGDVLVVDDARLPITSLNAAAEAVGIVPDVAQQEQFDVPPHGDLDERLAVDRRGSAGAGRVVCVRDRGAGHTARPRPAPTTTPRSCGSGPSTSTPPSTWATRPPTGARPTADRPATAITTEPYLYASPWAGRIDDFFGDPTFKGASLLYSQLVVEADPMAAALGFLREARDRIQRHV